MIKIRLSAEVQAALDEGRGVVALESTIIAHGMPYPKNVETGRALEAAVRAEGAVPATIACLDGEIRIGLNDEELEELGRRGREVLKLSRRDIPHALSAKAMGATTVAATLFCAEKAGIGVFATGGIGGVHRGASESFDVSADLYQLAESPVAVVCAGAKAILDLPATLELLETLSVPVVGVGCDELPAFYCRESGLPLPLRVDDPVEIAHYLSVKWAVDAKGGVILANPIPEEFAMPLDEMTATIESALASAEKEGIKGKEVTPYLLQTVVKATEGRSLEANCALAKNNATLAAKVAVALS